MVMTELFALDHIPRLMKDLGFGQDYYTEYKHFILRPGDTKSIEAGSQFYFLLGEYSDITIQSDFGVYDLGDPNLEEITYKHQGSIQISNNSLNRVHIRFIKVIPKN